MPFGNWPYLLEAFDFNKQYFLLLQSHDTIRTKEKDENDKTITKKDYARFKGTKFGGFISIITSLIVGFLTVNYIAAMSTSDNDTISSKKIIIDFDSNKTDKDDIEK